MRTATYRDPAFAGGCRKRRPSPPAENQMRPAESQIGYGRALQRSGRRLVRAATRSTVKAPDAIAQHVAHAWPIHGECVSGAGTETVVQAFGAGVVLSVQKPQ